MSVKRITVTVKIDGESAEVALVHITPGEAEPTAADVRHTAVRGFEAAASALGYSPSDSPTRIVSNQAYGQR